MLHIERLREILAAFFAAISPVARARRRELRIIREEKSLLSVEYREARARRQWGRQADLYEQMRELAHRELTLTRLRA